MDRERALNLSAAAELTGLTLRQLRQHLKTGDLPQTLGHDGKPRVTIGDLIDAGLLFGRSSGANAPGAGQGERSAGLQAWSVATADTTELLQRLLGEREQAASAWKERTETLYRELVTEQRERIGRLEDDKRDLTDKLHGALRQVPKLLELEKVEANAREAVAEAERLRGETAMSLERVTELERQIDKLERDLERADEKRGEAEASVRRLRERGIWSRLVDREPLPPEP